MYCIFKKQKKIFNFQRHNFVEMNTEKVIVTELFAFKYMEYLLLNFFFKI